MKKANEMDQNKAIHGIKLAKNVAINLDSTSGFLWTLRSIYLLTQKFRNVPTKAHGIAIGINGE